MNAIQETVNSESFLEELIDSTLSVHRHGLRQKLASLDRLIDRLARERRIAAGPMDRFQREFVAMAEPLETNLEEQQCWLFPLLQQLFESPGTTSRADYREEWLKEAMEQALAANQDALAALDRVQMCLCDPEWADKGSLVEELIDKLRELEEQLITFSELETKELSPLVGKGQPGMHNILRR